MILNPKTLNVLKNFASINPSALIKKGSVIRTMSPTQSVMAVATVPDVFDTEFAVYNLSRFINTISLLGNPELIFGEHSVLIKDDQRSVVYHYTEPSLLALPVRDKNPTLRNVEAEVILTHKNIQDVNKALGVLGLSDIAISGDGNQVMLQAIDSKQNDNFSIVIGETTKTFRSILRQENLKMVAGDYQVQLSPSAAYFKGEDIEYWIALES